MAVMNDSSRNCSELLQGSGSMFNGNSRIACYSLGRFFLVDLIPNFMEETF